ncbi:MAG: toxic anion resistance protein [Propionibacteriaceae bacterium]|nr:toxic anion resistance protein [Propionibacteriaceae bacterium]
MSDSAASQAAAATPPAMAAQPAPPVQTLPAPAPSAPGAGILTLEAPDPMPVVATTQAPAMAPQVDPSQVPILDDKVSSFMTQIDQAQTKSPEFAAQADAVRAMGDTDIQKAAETSNRLLSAPVKAMSEGGLAQGSTVGKTLMDLRRTVEDLDPHESTGVTKKILGVLPFGRNVQDYFRKYQSSQDHLNAILHALRSGQDELTRDNVALNMEKQNLWQTMGRLNQYVYIAEHLDTQLTARVAELTATDPARAQALSQDVLFYVRQKHQDLLTQLAVSIQNYLSIDIIIKNNIELIKGVDRASTTTVAALRTAVIVASALGNQKLVLDQITALNTTTSALIQRTSEMLKDNSAAIQEQAASSSIGLPQLQEAFKNIYETMDSIDAFKAKALTNMSQTISVLEQEVAKSRSYLDRVQNQPAVTIDNRLNVDMKA